MTEAYEMVCDVDDAGGEKFCPLVCTRTQLGSSRETDSDRKKAF